MDGRVFRGNKKPHEVWVWDTQAKSWRLNARFAAQGRAFEECDWYGSRCIQVDYRYNPIEEVSL